MRPYPYHIPHMIYSHEHSVMQRLSLCPAPLFETWFPMLKAGRRLTEVPRPYTHDLLVTSPKLG